MKIIRFKDSSGAIGLGEPIGNNMARRITGDLLGDYSLTDHKADIGEVEIGQLLAPIEPVNLIAIGLNYQRHAEEGGHEVPKAPVIFAKLTTSLTHPGAPIVLPQDAPDEVDYEAELAVVIGREARHISEADALTHVLGYMCANDVSARDCQIRRDQQWTRGKSFDTFCPLGPCLIVDPTIDPNKLGIRSKLNGQVMQESNTADMIFSVPQLISYLSHQFTLLPGTVILTGTPEGVGCARDPAIFLRDGDSIVIEIDGIGELVNPVKGSQHQ